MSKLTCAIVNAFSPYSMARMAHNLGMEKASTRILERNFGKQIGKTSESGLRAFYGTWSDGSKRIEVIDKDFKRRAHTIITRDKDGKLSQVQRILFRDGKITQTNLYKTQNPISVYGAQKQDVKYTHYITEHGQGIKQRSGSWSITLPSQKKVIHRNDNHILDHIM